MDEKIKTAFSFASDTTKQLITLSTGIITLTIAFSKDIFEKGTDNYEVIIVISWISFLISIIFGVWTLMALTGELEQVKEKHSPTIRGHNVTIPSIIQIFTFLIGIGFTVAFGIMSL